MFRFAILALSVVIAQISGMAADPRAVLFTRDWRFALVDDPAAAQPSYDDSGWRALSLPHDWAIEGDFSEDNPSGTGGGALPGGIGWYRKTFEMPAAAQGKHTYIDFDGAYMNASVYINGHLLGTRPYGYASFSYDLTPYLSYTEPNVVAVKVDNSDQPNSRWYSGCGIYRNVWLRTLGDVQIPLWGQCVRTDVDAANAVINVVTTVDNLADGKRNIVLRLALIDADGNTVATADACQASVAGQGSEVVSTLSLANPHLWCPADPYLYTLDTTVEDAATGAKLDHYTVTTGMRFYEFDPVKGFSLNGKPMKINGVCMHHDLGALGAVVNTRGIERQLEILKEMGANGYRCTHNPPAPEVLDLCDKMGFLVMDETFDMWRRNKTANDYARYFDEWHERDLSDLILRDRNHPSVIIWSIGNEVLEQWSDANADTLSLEQANLILNFGHSADMLASEGGELSVNSLLTRKLAQHVRDLDPTRPITAGCNEPEPGNHLFRSGALDIIGYNYHDEWMPSVPQKFPGKPFIITESVSALQTRGYYRMPSDSVVLAPDRWDIPYFDPTFSCSSYDNCHVPWGNTHEGTMRMVRDHDFISGQFVWTGFDYIGEPTPCGWPARSSYFGIVDLAGFPKDSYYMYQSQWRPDAQVCHLFPHWNWQEGQQVDMWCYFNNADEVELYLNGQSQGVRRLGTDDLHASWRLTYEPGTVEVIARKDGKEVARDARHTAGAPAAIRLTPDRHEITADGRDLSYVAAEVVDADGNLCPWAEDQITFAVNGVGFNAGVDNGSPISLERFKADQRRAMYGRAMLIVQSSGAPGPITVTATAPGLTAAYAAIAAAP